MKSDPIRIIDNSSALQNTVISGSAETPVFTSQLLSSKYYAQGALCHGGFYATPGPGTAGVVLIIRRGFGTGGSEAWQSPELAAVPGACQYFGVAAVFPADEFIGKGGQYTLTVRCIGAAGNGSLQAGAVMWQVSAYPWEIAPDVAVV